MTPNTNGDFRYSLEIEEYDLESNPDATVWFPVFTEFDDQTFIVRCYEREKLFYIQVFILENLEIAEKYSCHISMFNTENRKCNVTVDGDVISVDVQHANYGQENHPGTFTFTKTMLRKFVIENGTTLNIDITISKKNAT